MSSVGWKAALKEGPTASQAEIRYGLSSVPISTIAKQFYCEKQIDFENTIGKVTSEKELLGTDIHNELIDSKTHKIDIDEMIELIENEEDYLCIFPTWFKVDGMTIKGIPDLILFHNSKPVLLIELKSTSSYLNRTYKNQEVQCESYGFALDEMGFDCKDLMLAIVLVDRLFWDPLSKGDYLAWPVIKEVMTSVICGKYGRINKFKPLTIAENSDVIWHLKRYDRETALKNVTWASEYWLMKRDASFADHSSKCRNCQYNAKCSKEIK